MMVRKSDGCERSRDMHILQDGTTAVRKNTRGAGQGCFRECQFADDVALLTTTRKAAEEATMAYQDVAHALGLTVNIPRLNLWL